MHEKNPKDNEWLRARGLMKREIAPVCDVGQQHSSC